MYSRWHGAPTSFGPWGRLILSGLVLLFYPWGASSGGAFLYVFGYAPLAFVFLRSIWKKEAIVLPTEPVERDLPGNRELAALRATAAAIGLALVAVAIAAVLGLPLTLAPGTPFLLAALFPGTWHPVTGPIPTMRERPLGPLVAVNLLNVVDIVIGKAAIGSGAAEANPFVTTFGYPVKVALVAACSWLLYRKRPRHSCGRCWRSWVSPRTTSSG